MGMGGGGVMSAELTVLSLQGDPSGEYGELTASGCHTFTSRSSTVHKCATVVPGCSQMLALGHCCPMWDSTHRQFLLWTRLHSSETFSGCGPSGTLHQIFLSFLSHVSVPFLLEVLCSYSCLLSSLSFMEDVLLIISWLLLPTGPK